MVVFFEETLGFVLEYYDEGQERDIIFRQPMYLVFVENTCVTSDALSLSQGPRNWGARGPWPPHFSAE